MNRHDKIILEDLSTLSESEPNKREKESNRWKKFFIILGGILSLILALSFIFVTYPLGNILAGKTQSHLLIENIIELGKIKIIFEQNTAQELQTLYNQNQKTEWSACLSGTTQQANKPVYHITSLYQPKMYEQTFNHVTFEPCSKETLIMLHTHPYKSCIASDTDINTLKQTQKLNPDTIMVVMCEPKRFSVYS